MSKLNRVLFALLFVCVATFGALAIVSYRHSNATDDKFQASTLAGRIGSCASSTQRRVIDVSDDGLWKALDEALHEATVGSNAKLVGIVDRLHKKVAAHDKLVVKYVSTNPNCATLTPEQRAQALHPHKH